MEMDVQQCECTCKNGYENFNGPTSAAGDLNFRVAALQPLETVD